MECEFLNCNPYFICANLESNTGQNGQKVCTVCKNFNSYLILLNVTFLQDAYRSQEDSPNILLPDHLESRKVEQFKDPLSQMLVLQWQESAPDLTDLTLELVRCFSSLSCNHDCQVKCYS